MAMIEVGPAPSDTVRVIDAVNPRACRIVQRKAIFDPVRAGARGFDQLRRDSNPITLGKLKLEPVKAEQYLQLMIFGHCISYQDLKSRLIWPDATSGGKGLRRGANPIASPQQHK
jgi:hypothetical protein